MRYEGSAALVQRLAMVLLYTNTCRRRPSPEAIARGLQVSPRTALRYLAALEAAGWPMPPRQEGGRW